jgi:hypothetical protein
MAKKKRRKPLPGVSFEKAVHRIQQMMDPNTKVTHNEKLPDRVGNTRQYDVVIRGTLAGRPMLGVMECRDHNTRKGPDAIDGFANKMRNLGADFGIMVSRRGFTTQALRLAKFEKIICYSLVSNEFESGAAFGQYIYGIVRKWTDYGSVFRFRGPAPQRGQIIPDKILWQQKPVAHWILHELYEKYASKEPGTYFFRATFAGGLPVELNGTVYSLYEVGYQGVLIHTKKKTWVNWTGDAFFEWDKETLRIPGNTPLMSSAIEPRMNLWEDCDGEVPKGILLAFIGGQVLREDMAIPDLSSLNPICEILPVPESDPGKYLQ